MMQHQTHPTAYTDCRVAYSLACELADRDGDPIGIWIRNGWYVLSAVAPDCDEDDTRESDGWTLTDIVTPDTE